MNEEDFLKELMDYVPPPVVKKIEYRAYYREDGTIITYTTEDIPGNYIVITQEQYGQCRFDAKVQDGKLYYTHNRSSLFKLERNSTEGVMTSKYDINILVSDTEQDFNYWKNVIYDN